MAEVTLMKQRVDPERVATLREWLEGVQDREAEAAETLRKEGVYTETAFLEETADGTYLVTYMEAEDSEQAWEAFEASDREIDAEFKRIMEECLEDLGNVGEYERLYHLTNPER